MTDRCLRDAWPVVHKDVDGHIEHCKAFKTVTVKLCGGVVGYGRILPTVERRQTPDSRKSESKPFAGFYFTVTDRENNFEHTLTPSLLTSDRCF